MSFVLYVTLFLVIGYFAGGLPFGVWVGRAHGIDVRVAGSKNIGATNVGRLLGRKWGIVVFVLDMLKGLAPTLVGGMVLSGTAQTDPAIHPGTLELCRLLVGFTCILGHAYSPFLGFTGGKGVATSLGVTLGVFPELTFPALGAFFIWIVVAWLSRYVSLASITASTALPILFLLFQFQRGEKISNHLPLTGFVFVLAVLVIVRHRANIGRLLRGTESRWGGADRANG